ncbi:MAG: helix-turn-helix domain-containing protein [Solirubrobacteraceae bacterium]|nr:helix-turn-helix domain-containing protein [Solirubrobacteraceae bacterium]
MAAADPSRPTIPWRAVPPELADLIRPALPGIVEEIITAVRAEVAEYDQPMEGEFGRLISEGSTEALRQFVDLLGRDTDVPDVRVYEEMGRAELRAGRTLDSLQSAYRVGARVAWRQVAELGDRVDPRTLVAIAEAIFAYIDRLASASVAGYTQEQAARDGSVHARRHALVELLVTTAAPDPDAVAHLAEQADWPLPTTLAALAIEDPDVVPLARRLPEGTIGAALDPVAILLVPDPEGPGQLRQVAAGLRGRRAVLGPTVPWDRAHKSARRALAGWPLHVAGRLGDARLVRADDHLLELLLAGDEPLARELADRRLAPLRAMKPGAGERAEETLRAWLAAHGDVTRTAEALHVHPQTVRYRLAGLREVFGDELDDSAVRLELELALRAADLLGED